MSSPRSSTVRSHKTLAKALKAADDFVAFCQRKKISEKQAVEAMACAIGILCHSEETLEHAKDVMDRAFQAIKEEEKLDSN